ncbi:MAG: tRNA pseudouridine(38-40) synthase TruA [Acidobacteria bacterium]|nr:tRNA pseudouridine(38-40) synthase TruA [Acidobacteriota bacterium]
MGGPAAFRLRVEYDGSRFQGWQRQGTGQEARGVRTVAGTLERVLSEGGLRVRSLVGAGRTDAGVHALGQVAHLHLDGKVPRPGQLQILLDQGLPSDVAVHDISPCPASFHARHDALERSYLYQLCLRRTGLAKPFVWWVKGKINKVHLKLAWKNFHGFHNIKSFSDLLESDDPRCDINTCDLEESGSILLLRVTASHFKYRQVRRMVGAAVACAQGKSDPGAIQRDLLEPTPEACLRWAALAAPAAGLFLEGVRYEGDPPFPPLRPVTLVP